MKNPLKRLKQWLKPQPESHQALEDELHSAETIPTDPNMKVDMAVMKVLAKSEIYKARGGVVKTKHKQYKIDDHPHGGRVVKTMPKQIRYMKELADKTDD